MEKGVRTGTQSKISFMALQPTRKSKKGHYGKKGRTVYIHAGIWYNKKTGHIQIAEHKETKFISMVSNDPKSKRYHPHLYKKLKGILVRGGCL